MNRLRLFKDVPRLFDAWDIDSNYVCQEIEGACEVAVEPVEEGLEAVLKVTGRISQSRLYAVYPSGSGQQKPGI